MTSSRSSSSRIAVGLLVLLLALPGCAGHVPSPAQDGLPARGIGRIAVLPIDNLSGGTAPLKVLRQGLEARLRAHGIELLPEAELDAFMARRRLRYVGGVARDDAAALRTEAGVDGVLVTSLELYNESYPPRLALTSRLVAAGNEPRILRMTSIAMAGDDAPGLLGLGLVSRAPELRDLALDRLAAALASGEEGKKGPALTPATVFHGQPLDPAKRYTVAVLPLFNKGSRRYAGEITALHFIRELVKSGRFEVIEPGLVREELLRYRIIMEEGVSLADAEIVFGVLKADLLLSGDVNEYEEIQGNFGAPRVDFTALLLNRDNRKAGWAVDAHATGDDRVHFFDIGRLTTASALAAAMVRGAVETLTSNDLTPQQ